MNVVNSCVIIMGLIIVFRLYEFVIVFWSLFCVFVGIFCDMSVCRFGKVIVDKLLMMI